MNERIQELAREAGITTNLDTDYFEKDMNKWVDYYSEKFAELIIRECVPFVGYENSQAVRKMLEHFGVEP